MRSGGSRIFGWGGAPVWIGAPVWKGGAPGQVAYSRLWAEILKIGVA